MITWSSLSMYGFLIIAHTKTLVTLNQNRSEQMGASTLFEFCKGRDVSKYKQKILEINPM